MSLSYRRDIRRQKRRRRNAVVSLATLSVLAVLTVTIYLVLVKTFGNDPAYVADQGGSEDRITVDLAATESVIAKNTEVLSSKIETETEEATTQSDTEAAATETTEPEAASTSEDTIPATDGILNAGYTKNETAVDDSYFDDAVFIGDSRTEGFALYSDLAEVNTYSSKGLSVTRIYEDTIVPMGDGQQVTVMEALRYVHYNKIYIMFGVNELGWVETDIFRDKYETMIADIRALQPDSIIYVQGIIPVSAERSATDSIYNNDRVRQFNEEIRQACIDQNVVYLDVGSALVDGNGALPAGASTDGIHCNSEYCNKWLEYLKQNTYTVK